MFDTSLYI